MEFSHRALCLWLAALWCLRPAPSTLTSQSDSYLSLEIDSATITGQWDIALRDLEYAIGLDCQQ
jgi:hypothetical protein